MARPREFDEGVVLAAAAESFWIRGYEATSVRDLVETTGVTSASLYNAFGDKHSLYLRALDYYVEGSVSGRIERCKKLAPREAIVAFFGEIVRRSLGDRDHKGCMLVNAALDVAPHDPEFRVAVNRVLIRLEAFFLERVRAGQKDKTINRAVPADDIARHLLAVLLGIRVLARVRPEKPLLEGAVRSSLKILERKNESE